MAAHTWTVTELCAEIETALQERFPGEVWVRGQVSGTRRPPSGHLYFQLVDPDTSGGTFGGQLPIVAFKGQLRGIEALLRKVGDLRIEDGVEVRVRGRISFYGPQGRVQLQMTGIDPSFTLGQLAAERDEVLRRLAAEGLMTTNKARPLAPVPLRVGLVTSDGSAAYNDFVDELQRSGYPFRITLADARVQGADAEASLVAAITTLGQLPLDVIAVVRGGGARTDLLAFDRESVARAVATCPVPVLVGVGHEIDRSVVDDVGHLSLKTPTACADAVVERVRSFHRRLEQIAENVSQQASDRLTHAQQRVAQRAVDLARLTLGALRWHGSLLDQRRDRLSRAETVLSIEMQRLNETGRRLESASRQTVRDHDRRLVAAAALTSALHPDRILARGFSVTRTADGTIVTGTAPIGTRLITTTAGGLIDSDVTGAQERPSSNINSRNDHTVEEP